MSVRVTSTLGGLSRSAAAAPAELRNGRARIARGGAEDGNRTGKRIARRRYGRGHAREYASHFTVERRGPGRYEFGPEARGQGLLAPILERGSINNPAHLNLEQAADLMQPGLYRSVDSWLDGLFHRG